MDPKLARIVAEIDNDFKFIKPKVLGLVLFGSFASGQQTERSDIDVCIVVGTRDRGK